jgi:hypothetical protein
MPPIQYHLTAKGIKSALQSIRERYQGILYFSVPILLMPGLNNLVKLLEPLPHSLM